MLGDDVPHALQAVAVPRGVVLARGYQPVARHVALAFVEVGYAYLRPAVPTRDRERYYALVLVLDRVHRLDGVVDDVAEQRVRLRGGEDVDAPTVRHAGEAYAHARAERYLFAQHDVEYLVARAHAVVVELHRALQAFEVHLVQLTLQLVEEVLEVVALGVDVVDVGLDAKKLRAFLFPHLPQDVHFLSRAVACVELRADEEQRESERHGEHLDDDVEREALALVQPRDAYQPVHDDGGHDCDERYPARRHGVLVQEVVPTEDVGEQYVQAALDEEINDPVVPFARGVVYEGYRGLVVLADYVLEKGIELADELIHRHPRAPAEQYLGHALFIRKDDDRQIQRGNGGVAQYAHGYVRRAAYLGVDDGYAHGRERSEHHPGYEA